MKNRTMTGALAVLALSHMGFTQETVNGGMVVLGPLRSSGSSASVDFTAAGSTSPVKSGTLAARPGSCTVGQMYFATDAAAGQNLAYCTSAGAWAVVAGGTGAGVNAQSGTSYTLQDGDCGKLVTLSNAAAVSVTLPRAGVSWFTAGWVVDVQNRGAGNVTITPSTSTIDGGTSLVLAQNTGVRIVSDGTNYFTARGMGSAASGSLAGDVTGALGATTVAKVNGASLPADGFPVQSNGSGQMISANVDPYTGEHAGATVSVQFGWGYCLTTTSAISTDFAVAASTGTKALFTAPSGWIPTRIRWVLGSDLTTDGTGVITDVAVSVGTNTTQGAFTQYLPASPIRTADAAPGNTYGDFMPGGSAATTASATQVVTAQLAITNANPGTLNHINGGSITFTVCGK